MSRGKSSRGLNLDGQSDLLAGSAPLEQRLVEVPNLNNAPNYGVTIESLAPFLEKVRPDGKPLVDVKSFFALMALVDAVHNTESFDGNYGFSHDIRIRQNTAEMLATDMSLHPIKYTDGHTPQFRAIVEFARQDFPTFVSDKVSEIYGRYPAIRRMANQGLGYNRHPKYRGALVERMKQVRQEDIERAVNSLLLENRGPGETTRELKYPYPYPLKDVKRDSNYELRLHYAWAVVNFYKKLYLFNTRTGTTAGRRE